MGLQIMLSETLKRDTSVIGLLLESNRTRVHNELTFSGEEDDIIERTICVFTI